MSLRHCTQCGKEMAGPPGDRELRLRTTYAPSDLSFCGARCLVLYLSSAPEHRKELIDPMALPV